MVSDGLAVAAMGVTGDREVVLKATLGAEEVEGAKAEVLAVEGVGDGKDHGGRGL